MISVLTEMNCKAVKGISARSGKSQGRWKSEKVVAFTLFSPLSVHTHPENLELSGNFEKR